MSDAAQADRASMSNGSAQASAIVRIEIRAMAPERGEALLILFPFQSPGLQIEPERDAEQKHRQGGISYRRPCRDAQQGDQKEQTRHPDGPPWAISRTCPVRFRRKMSRPFVHFRAPQLS